MHEYKSIQTDNNDYTLVKDGMQAMCPKTQPRVVQSQVGQTQMVRFPCTTNCPFASIEERKQEARPPIDNPQYAMIDDSAAKFNYIIECEGAHKIIPLTELIKKEKAKVASLIAQ